MKKTGKRKVIKISKEYQNVNLENKFRKICVFILKRKGEKYRRVAWYNGAYKMLKRNMKSKKLMKKRFSKADIVRLCDLKPKEVPINLIDILDSLEKELLEVGKQNPDGKVHFIPVNVEKSLPQYAAGQSIFMVQYIFDVMRLYGVEQFHKIYAFLYFESIEYLNGELEEYLEVHNIPLKDL